MAEIEAEKLPDEPEICSVDADGRVVGWSGGSGVDAPVFHKLLPLYDQLVAMEKALGENRRVLFLVESAKLMVELKSYLGQEFNSGVELSDLVDMAKINEETKPGGISLLDIFDEA